MMDNKERASVFLLYAALGIIYFSAPLFSGKLLSTADSEIYYYPFKVYYSDFIKNGFPLWMPYEFMGFSFLGSTQQGSLYLPNFLYFALPTAFTFNLLLILHFTAAAFFLYLYLRAVGLKNRAACFGGGLVFGFSGLVMAHRHYIEMTYTTAWIPVLLFLYERIRAKGEARYVVWAGLAAAMQLFAGHLQICAFTYFFLAFFTLYRFAEDRNYRLLFLSAAPIAIGVLSAAPQLVSVSELLSISQRSAPSYDFMKAGSFAPFMFPIFVFPFVFGGGHGIPYLGVGDSWHLVEYAAFTGSLPLVLALAVFFFRHRGSNHVRFWGIVAAAALFLAFGGFTPLYRIMSYVPVLKLFRFPSRYLLFFNLGIAVLFAFALESLSEKTESAFRLSSSAIRGLAFVGLAGIAYCWFGKSLMASYFPVYMKGNVLSAEALDQYRNFFSFRSRVFSIPLGLIAAYSLIIWASVKFRFKRAALVILLVVVAAAEAYSFGAFFDNDWPRIKTVKHYYKNEAFDFLKKNAGFERVAFVATGSQPLYHLAPKIQAVNGYDSLRPGGFFSLAGTGIPMDTELAWKTLIPDNRVLSLMNVKYLVTSFWYDMPEEKITGVRTPVVEKRLRPEKTPVALGNWEYVRASAQGNGVRLASPDGNSVSLIQQKLRLKPDTYYKLYLEARSAGAGGASFVYDLYAPGYDFPEQELSGVAGAEAGAWSKIIFTGTALPAEVRLRLFTFSKNPVEARNLRIEEFRPKEYFSPYAKVYESGGVKIFENKARLPRAFFVDELRPVSRMNEIKSCMDDLDFDPRSTGLVNKEDLAAIGSAAFGSGTAKVVRYEPEKIEIEAEVAGRGFLVLADQHFPGWKAYVDGRETRIYNTYGMFRGIVVPEGSHRVVFRYLPAKIYAALSLGASIFAGCLIFLAADLRARRKKGAAADA